MLFGSGMFLAAGATITLALIDKTFEDFGSHWFGTVIRIALPLVGLALGSYFLETNAMVGWLR